jgi:WD40 repeat protein
MFLNDDRSLVSVGDDERICLWNWHDGSLLDSFSDHYHLLAAARSMDNSLFATGNDSGIVRLWRVEKNRLVQMHSLSGPASIRAMCFTPDGKSLAISGDDKKIRFWQVSSGLELFAISDLPSYVHRLSFSSDGQRLAAALHNGEVRVYYAPKVAKPSPFLP